MPAADSFVTVLSRTRPQARRFARAMRARNIGGAILFAPVLRIVVIGGGLPGGDLVFTSQNGVAAARGMGALAGRRVFAVGRATAVAARAAGARAISADGDVAALAALITRTGSTSVTHLHGRHVTGDLAGRLRAQGIPARAVAIYDQKAADPGPAARRALARGGCIVPVFSRRSAALLGSALSGPPARVRLAAISANAAGGWPWPGEVVVSATPDAAGMLDLLDSLVAEGRGG